MKAIVFRGPGELIVEERAEPKPGPGEILVRPLYAAVSSADVWAYLDLEPGEAPDGEPTSRDPALGAATIRPGTIVGHEFGAVVEALGPGVDGATARVGDRCSIDPRIVCGDCSFCRAGYGTHCERGGGWLGLTAGDGGLAELCVVPQYACFAVETEVTDLETALVAPLCCATRAVRLSGMVIGDNVAILGADDSNLGVVRWARLGGARRIVVVDHKPARRAIALQAGADEAIDPKEVDVTAEIRASMPWGADVVFVSIEGRDSEDYVRQACEAARPQAQVVIVRIRGNRAFQNVPGYVPLLKEITFRHFGNSFGEEPWRGGRSRGDWQLTLDAMARRDVTERCLPVEVVDFRDVKTRRDVDDVYRSIPEKRAKVAFRIAGRPPSNGAEREA